jgi:hypothetical protein
MAALTGFIEDGADGPVSKPVHRAPSSHWVVPVTKFSAKQRGIDETLKAGYHV